MCLPSGIQLKRVENIKFCKNTFLPLITEQVIEDLRIRMMLSMIGKVLSVRPTAPKCALAKNKIIS